MILKRVVVHEANGATEAHYAQLQKFGQDAASDDLQPVDSNGQTIWIADAHRDDGKRFVVRADEKLTAFWELEAATRVDPQTP